MADYALQNDEADIYNSALEILQECELLAKSTDYNDIIDCAETLVQVDAMLDEITSFGTNALRKRVKNLEEKINLI